MDLKTSKISKRHPSNLKEKKIKSFLSCLELSDNQSKEKQIRLKNNKKIKLILISLKQKEMN